MQNALAVSGVELQMQRKPEGPRYVSIYLRFCLFEMYVNMVFVIRSLYSAVILTLVRE